MAEITAFIRVAQDPAEMTQPNNSPFISVLIQLFQMLSVRHLLGPGRLGRKLKEGKRLAEGQGIRILQFERVRGKGIDEVDLSPDRFLDTRNFRKLIDFLHREHSIEELRSAAAGIVEKRTVERPTVSLVFSGGYLEHYQTVLPVLDALNIKAAFFIPPAFIGTQDLFWFQKIEITLSVLQKYQVPIQGFQSLDPVFNEFWRERDPDLGITPKKVQLLLECLWDSAPALRVSVLEELLQFTERLPPPRLNRQFMNWEEVREIAQRGHTLGTMGERAIRFSELSTDALGQELRKAFETLKRKDLQYTNVLLAPGGMVTADQRIALKQWGIEVVLGSPPSIEEQSVSVIEPVCLTEKSAPNLTFALREIWFPSGGK